jgi:hypothetical protein
VTFVLVLYFTQGPHILSLKREKGKFSSSATHSSYDHFKKLIHLLPHMPYQITDAAGFLLPSFKRRIYQGETVTVSLDCPYSKNIDIIKRK